MEMKFYEKLGIRKWKKFLLWFMSKIIRNPEKRKGGYYLADISLEAAKKYRKTLLINALIHIWCSIIFSLIIINIIMVWIILKRISFFFLMICSILGLIINLYCVMMQRYNWLRIKRILTKVAHK